MAYGKIKADAIIYDNSGSDVEKTIASLATPTPEGTAVKSTGESGTTKFLRVDGDGTCSWQVPSYIANTDTQLTAEQVQDFVGAMVTGNTETGITVTYEDSDGTLDFVVGTLNQDTTGTAAIATEITATANNSTDETVYPTFVDGATGTQGIETDTGLTYNPSTGLLTAVGLTLSGNLTVNGTTTTVASTNTTIADNLLELNSGASSNANDSGIIIERGSTGDNAIIAWDESADKFVVGTTTGTASSTGDITIATGTLVDNVEGNASTATTATNVVGVGHGTNAAYRVPFLSADTGTAAVYTDTNQGMTYNPSTNLLYVSGSFEDGKGDVRKIPHSSQTSNYTLVAADAGKVVSTNTTGWVIPTSIFAGGDAVTLMNRSSGDLTINASALTALYNSTDGANVKASTLTLATRTMATIWFEASDTAYIQASALTVS